MTRLLASITALLVCAACEKPVDRVLRLQADSARLDAANMHMAYRQDSVRRLLEGLPATAAMSERIRLQKSSDSLFLPAMAISDSLKRVTAELRLAGGR